MSEEKRYLFLNQMAGPLFRELAEGLTVGGSLESELYTGHSDTLNFIGKYKSLKITRSPLYNRSSKFTRAFSWVNYSILAFFKILFCKQKTTIFMVSNPPILGPLALFACKLRMLNYIVLVYDIHPDTLISFGMLREDSFFTSIWRWVNRIVYQNADAVFTIGEVMAERLGSQFLVEKTKLKKVGVIPPWADTDKIKPLDKSKNPLIKKFGLEHKIVVLYSGNMGISHDIESMLEAAEILQSESDIHFMFIGEGEQWAMANEFVSSKGLKNVTILPFQEESMLPFTMTLADISLVALDKGAEGLMIPSKMFYYMAAGSSLIGISQGKNDLCSTIENSYCGINIEPQQPQELANSIKLISGDKELLTKFKKNARTDSLKRYSKIVCLKKLKEQLENL